MEMGGDSDGSCRGLDLIARSCTPFILRLAQGERSAALFWLLNRGFREMRCFVVVTFGNRVKTDYSFFLRNLGRQAVSLHHNNCTEC